MAPPIPSIFFTQGDTFSLGGFANLPAGDTWGATAELRDNSGNLVQELTVTLQAPTPPDTSWPLLLQATAAQTDIWPLGPLTCDIRFQYQTTVIHSAKFIVNVTNQITTSQPTIYV